VSESDLSRRVFLKILGTSTGAGAAVACSPRHATDHLIPLLNPPENAVPGEALYYRTVCQECPAGCGITAKSREGRVIKLEGNPDHPINRGALCARGQAALQGLYAPDRLRQPMRRGPGQALTPVPWDTALNEIAVRLNESIGSSQGIVLLGRSQPGSVGALQEALSRVLGESGDRLVYEPFDPAALRAASRAAFGLEEIPVFRIDTAQLTLSLGADFLETWPSPVEHARQLREARSAPGGRARLVFVGPQLSLTAANADLWLPALPETEGAVALALCKQVLQAGPRASLPADLAAHLRTFVAGYDARSVEQLAHLPEGSLDRLAKQLIGARSSVVLPPGPLASGAGATSAALAVLLLNYLLGNCGHTVLYGQDPLLDTPSSHADVRALTARMTRGEVKALLIFDADPVGTLPADLGFADALRHVPMVVFAGTEPNATSELAHYLLAQDHFLESWTDTRVRNGVLGLGQPTLRPLFDTRSQGDLLLQLAARLHLKAAVLPFKSFQEFWRERAADYAMLEEAKSGDLLAAVRAGQQKGGFFHEVPAVEVALGPEMLDALAKTVAPSSGDQPLLVAGPDLRAFDGRSFSHSWMREVPDPMTTVSWASPLQLSPAMAEKLGVQDGDRIAVGRGALETEFPVHISPGLVEGVVALPAGAPDVLRLLPDRVDAISGARAFAGSRVTLHPTRVQEKLAQAIGSGGGLLSQHGRELARTVATRTTPVNPAHAPLPSLYPEHLHEKHRWAMAVDLDHCTGCQACVAACYAENNIPVLGPEQAAIGRSMAWIRIERYLEAEKGGPPRASFLPMLCQQCCNAPCESVCPVEATYHTEEGLNAQVYNRCVGTRYCANNCPYKARVFNFSNHEFPAPLPMSLNPDVSIREKGIMEKCTFCVQRIRFAENDAQREGRAVRDGEVVPACAQTCPAQAITFGDIRDPKSEIFKVARDPRGYRVMEDLNTEPGVTYLARVVPEVKS
jgi:molybdopterin-containing oxidoreductase family iron-sulfur binding subunit